MKKEDKEILIMFAPKSERDIRRSYPELSRIKEFTGLSSSELLFTWWHSNRTSPFYHLTDEKSRVSQSFDRAFGKNHMAEKDRYLNGFIPEKIKSACSRMEKFDSDVRSRAKMMVEKIMNKFEETVDMPKEAFYDNDGNLDVNKKRAYIETCSKIADKLPDLVAQLESGYGITDAEETEFKFEAKAIDDFHRND